MELLDRFEIVEPYPSLFWREEDLLIISDLHIGIEVSEARSGTLMPRFQMREVVEDIEELQEESGASRMLVDGDVKHSFGGGDRKENKEVERFLDRVSAVFDEVLLVEGNHDAALEYRIEDYTNVSLAQRYMIGDVVFAHGHEAVELEDGVSVLVIGHEHPALVLADEVGVKEKVACFLYGPMEEDRKLLVLPAFSKLAAGTEINEVPQYELLSPVLQEQVDVDGLEAVAVDRDAGVFTFPTIGELRSL
ncbi:MAG: metallophosphoesterase [Candidatus Nanohaloarchaea archaeon]|nr:metallophosphoesterase [Candidatus Nanohaloarchaea archaeon]